jgi:hypothetical protein
MVVTGATSYVIYAVASQATYAVTLRSEIPPDHPQKAALESAVRRALGTAQGPWSASLLRGEVAAWWLLVIARPRQGFRGCVVLEPHEQTPERAEARICEWLRMRLPARGGPSAQRSDPAKP